MKKESKWLKRRSIQKITVLLLAVCISVSGLSVAGYTGTGSTGTAGGKPGAYTDAGNLQGSPSGESQDIVRGFGSKIKDKKQKEIKVRVNHGNQGNRNGKSWNLQMLQAENVNAGKAEGSGRKIKVAVIDSGINFSTDLPVAVRKNFIPEDERNVLYEDPSGHGTAVAGIIAALDNDEGITGINPRVELYSARVLDGNLEAPVGRIAEAIDWAVGQDVDIINMSFGIAKNVKELEEAVGGAAAAGILLVAAAGNGETVAYPAAYDEVIAVGSVTAEGLAAEGSASGEALELMAPGENILSSGIFGGVTGMSGTSMAAPHVAGAASVLMELNPEMPADYIRMLLNYSANLYGSPDEYGNGVLDLGYAIEINDKFKKLYEKHIDKAEKNKKKKEKQKEKFWGEVLKTIPENEKAVETFTGVEVVEGMWLKDNRDHEGKRHEDFIYDGLTGTQMSFTAAQMAVLTFACGYPDKADSGLHDMDDNPYHGFLWQRKKTVANGKTEYTPLYNSNYIANYIFLTKLAKAFGNAASVPKGTMFQNDYDRILEDITTTRLGTRTWEQVFDLLNSDREVNLSVTSENKRLFIYGIAIHCISDTFAHSTWAEQSGVWKRVSHKNYNDPKKTEEENNEAWKTDADNPDYFPMRYKTAQAAVQSALAKACYGTEGLLADFLFPSINFGTFYLGNYASYAKRVNSQIYNSGASAFDSGDLDKNVLNYNFEKHTYYVQ